MVVYVGSVPMEAGNWPSVSGYDLLAEPLKDADSSVHVGVIDWISLAVGPDWQLRVAGVVMAAAADVVYLQVIHYLMAAALYFQ